MELKTDAILKGPIWADTLERLVGKVFKTYWDVYALSISSASLYTRTACHKASFHGFCDDRDLVLPFSVQYRQVTRTVLLFLQDNQVLYIS